MPPPLPLALARIQAALDDQTCVFVFPSESAAQAYADTVLERGVSTPGGVCAVRLDRFIAWDTFKLSAIKTAAPLQTASPSAGATPLQTATPGTATPLIRKLFAAAMLEENAARKKAGGAAYFGALIPPAYAAYSPAFASWIAGMLPQLALWQEAAGGRTADGESADLLVLFGLYRQFLDDNNLFESAWERPPFIRQDGRRYIIFFPEIIPDYAGYQALLEAAGEYIQTVNIPPPPHPPRAFFYQNARSEITDAARYILRLAEQGAAWHDIVVGVPENGDYLPHLKSEFFNRNIPYTDKNGKKLNEYPAGRLFSGILECYTQNFAFEPLVNLLSNAALPWKERGQIDKLIAFGLENNCVCGWEEDGALVDVWKTARFSSEDISVFYTDLKTAILRLCHAKTLSAVKKSYFAFRDRFLDRDGGGAASDTTDSAASADAVIARCVAELAALEQVCKTYPSIAPASPFSFWVKHLAETVYTARSDGGGVGLCSYRIAAALPAAYHVVVGANQANMAQTNTRLDFSRALAPELLASMRQDVSDAFFHLHIASAEKEAAFFCSEETFSGFAIPFGRLQFAAETGEARGALLYRDLFDEERAFLAGNAAAMERLTLHTSQQRGFAAFCARNDLPETAGGGSAGCGGARGGGTRGGGARAFLVRAVKNRLCAVSGTAGGGSAVGGVIVSASALKPFYECALRWLFSRVLRIQALDTRAGIFDPMVFGILYHAILSDFFMYMKTNHLLFAVEKNGALRGVLSEALGASTSRVFENLDNAVYTSVVKKTLIYPQKEAVHAALLALVTETARAFSGSAVFLVEERLRVPLDGLQIEGAADAAYLDGAPDLVLEDEDGNFSIVDFKSAALPPKPDCLARDAGAAGERALGDFQMPAYYTLLKAGMGKSAARGFFASVKDAKIAPYFAPQKTGRTETARFEDVLEPFRRQTAKYIQSVCTRDFDIYINTIHSVCADCEYTRVCRRSRAAPRPAPAFFGEETA